MNGFVFYRKYDSIETVVRIDNPDISWDELCRYFEEFMRGCGFNFDGHVDVVGDLEDDEEVS